jgi:hypothetical protein
MPILDRDEDEAELLGPQPWILVAMRHADQPAVAAVAPCVIGAGQHLRAAAGSVDQPRAAMPAYVGERADFAIIPANDDHALAEIFQCAPFPGLGNLAFVADHLRRGA